MPINPPTDYRAAGKQLPVPALGSPKRKKRGWFLTVSYPYLAEAFRRMGFPDFSESDFRALMRQLVDDYMEAHAGCRWLGLMFHDLDPEEDEHHRPILRADGTCDAFKELHAHIDIYDENMPTWGSLVAWFHMSDRKQNAIPWSGARERTHWVLYITHSNQQAREQGKYEYDIASVYVLVRGIPSDDAPEHVAMREAFFRRLRSGHMPEDADEKAGEKAAFEKMHGDLVFYGRESPDDVKLLLESDDKTRKRLSIQSDTAYPTKVLNLMNQRLADRLATLKRYYVDDGNPRRLLTTYIKAPGLSSKTTTAYLLAKHVNEANHCTLGIQQIAAPGNRRLTFDPAGSYDGEEVAIANEFVYRAFGGSAAKDMLDPTVVPIVSSRNVDKFWPIQYLFATASEDAEEQVRGAFASLMAGQVHRGDAQATGAEGRFSNRDWDRLMLEKDGDQLNQLARRIGLVIEMVEPARVFVAQAAASAHEPYALVDRNSANVGRLDAAGLAPGSFLVVISGYDSREGKAEELDFHGNVRPCRPVSYVTCKQTGEPLYPAAMFHGQDWNRNERQWLALTPVPQGSGVEPTCSGRWTPLACLVYRPGDPASQATLLAAFDGAERDYYAMNGYDKNPDTVPFMPDIEAYAAKRAEAIREAADAFERQREEQADE